MPSPYFNAGIFKTKITDVNTTAQEEIGISRYEAGKILRYMQATSLVLQYTAVQLDVTTTTAALMGAQVVALNPLQAQGTGGGAQMPFVGIAEATIPLNNFGWITVNGPATGRVVTATIPGTYVGGGTVSGILGVANASQMFLANAIALQTGLSAGSAIFILVGG